MCNMYILQVSLTAPKLCAKKFCGLHHFLGGRFVPPFIADKYKLQLPSYPGTSMCVRMGKPQKIDVSALRENYISPEFLEEQAESNPIDQVQIQQNHLVFHYLLFQVLFFKLQYCQSLVSETQNILIQPLSILQFRKWFEDAMAAGLREPNAMGLATAGKDGKP